MRACCSHDHFPEFDNISRPSFYLMSGHLRLDQRRSAHDLDDIDNDSPPPHTSNTTKFKARTSFSPRLFSDNVDDSDTITARPCQHDLIHEKMASLPPCLVLSAFDLL